MNLHTSITSMSKNYLILLEDQQTQCGTPTLLVLQFQDFHPNQTMSYKKSSWSYIKNLMILQQKTLNWFCAK